MRTNHFTFRPDHHAPVLLPAAALAAGASFAFQLTVVSVPLLIALGLLGFALRRRAGVCLAAFAAGALAAVVVHVLPGRPLAGLDRSRPVEVTGRVDGHWTADDDGWTVPFELSSVRQEERIVTPRTTVLLHLPGDEPPPAFGSHLRLRGYLSRSAGFSNRVATPPGPWRMRVKSRLLAEIEAGPGPVARLSGRLRARLERAYGEAVAGAPGEPAGPGVALTRAFVLGDATGLPISWRRGLRLTGLSHLLSVSGVHVALVAGAVLLLGSFLPRTLRLLAALAAIALYLLLVGPLPALVRAAVMGGLAVLALLAQRPPAAANALGWAVILLVLERPEVVRDPSFQLSVAATAGLLLLAPALAARWTRLPAAIAQPLSASFAAQLCALPWALPLFYLLTPAAPLANLLALPWAAVALVAALAWSGLAVLAPEVAGVLLPALDLLAAPLGWPSLAGEWTVALGCPLLVGRSAAALLSLSLCLLLLARRWPVRLAALAVAAALVWQALPPERGVELALLDVGQGDAILLRDGRRTVLVDGGGWRRGDLGGRVLLPALLAEGVRRLDAVVLTHPDRDHCGGLVDIAGYLPIAEVWMSPGWDPAGCAGELLGQPGVRHRFLAAGDRARVGRWRLAALHPERGETRGEDNDRSLVLRAEALGRSVLLTGDLGTWGELRLLSCCAGRLRCDLLKVGHHGSRSSSGNDFLDTVRPRLALISAGPGNVFRHPAPETLDRLEERGIRVLRTDRDGLLLVTFHPDGRWRIALPGSPR
jgi:competence protein ComEC